MISNKHHKPFVVCSALLGAIILFPTSAFSSTGNPSGLGPFANDPYAEPVEWAQRHRGDNANRHKFTSRRREAHRRSERHRRSDRHRRREHNRERNHRYNQHDNNGYGGERHAPYGQYDRHYRSNLGINFFFGSSGYSTYRWAPSPYSFYRPGYWPYRDYRANTHCERIYVEANHYDHTEIISVKQCHNPFDGDYIIQGSERIVDCIYAGDRW